MFTVRRSMLFALCLCAALALPAQAAEPVTNTLTVQHVIVRADGSETLEAAAAAKPGEVLEYTAEFHNAGPQPARGLEATLPIPVGVTLIAGSAHPAGARASVDGTSFAPLPLTRRVKQADGSLAEEPVPLSDYRFLRWAPTDLAANASFKVSARVEVAAGPPAPSSSR